MGDVLREIHSKELIEGDFVLMSIDTVTNMNLQEAMKFHSEKKQSNNYHVLTKIYKQIPLDHSHRNVFFPNPRNVKR